MTSPLYWSNSSTPWEELDSSAATTRDTSPLESPFEPIRASPFEDLEEIFTHMERLYPKVLDPKSIQELPNLWGKQYFHELPLLNSVKKLVSFNEFSLDISLLHVLLKKCPNLTGGQFLNMSDDALLEITSIWPHLEDIQFTGDVTDQGIISLVNRCSNITNASFSRTKITDEGVAALAKGAPNLIKLDLTRTNVTSDGAKAIAERCHNLREFYAASCHIEDRDLFILATHCKHLQILDISNIPVTDDGIVAIAENCSLLAKLTLIGCNQLTNKSLLALATHSKHLTELSLDWTSTFTLETLHSLAKSCDKLKQVSLWGVVFDDAVSKDLKKSYPHITIDDYAF